MKLKLLVAAACAAFGTALFAAGELDEAVLHGETDKARAATYLRRVLVDNGSDEPSMADDWS